MDDDPKEGIHCRLTNLEDDYDRQRIVRHVCRLLWPVRRILLELQEHHRLNYYRHHHHQVLMVDR